MTKAKKAPAGISLALITLASVALCAFTAPQAFAAYTEVGAFADNGSGPGGSGSEDGQLSSPGQAEVNDSTGKLYVADTNNNRVQAFSPTATGGTYDVQVPITAPTGLAIDQSTGAVYVANATGIAKFDSSLNPVILGWTDPAATGNLAVDPSTGDLLVADQGANLIRRFHSDGTAAGTFAAERPVDLAVNSTGEVLVVTSTGDITGSCGPTSAVQRFSGSGSPEGTVGASLEIPGAVAVDPDDDSIAVAANVGEYFCEHGPHPRIALFDATGAATETVELTDNTLYAMVPGLTAQGGGSSRMYAITKSPANDGFGNTKAIALEDLSPPEAVIDLIDPDTVTATEAAFSGSVDPNGASTDFHFEFRIGSSGTWSATPTQSAGLGTSPVPTGEVLASGLQPNVDYQVRLLAANADGSHTAGPVSFHTDVSAPIVQTLSAQQLTDSGAWLRASINPNAEPTTYYFEYGPTVVYGSFAPAAQNGSVSGVGAITVSEPLNNLQPNTTYHYRVVAHNATGISKGEDRSFTTTSLVNCSNEAIRGQQHATYLPDCRAYELVSPREKFGMYVGNQNGYAVNLRLDRSGDRLSYRGTLPIPPSLHGGQAGLQATRTAAGWQNVSLLPPSGPTQSGIAVGYLEMVLRATSADQRTALFWDNTTAPWGSLAVRRADGSIVRIFNAPAFAFPAGGDKAGHAWGAGLSPDGSRALFTSNVRIADAVGLPGNADLLYEWVDDGSNGGAGSIRLVNRTNHPTPTLLSTSAAELGGSPAVPAGGGVRAGFGIMRGLRHAISDGSDGHTRVFFQNPAPAANNALKGGPVYLREDGALTAEVSAPEGASPPATDLRYLDATPAGTHVFFWSGSKLTDDASAEQGIYRYDIDANGGSGDLVFLASAPTVASAPPTAMASDDGHRIYYQKGADVYLNEDGVDRLVQAGVIGAGAEGFIETEIGAAIYPNGVTPQTGLFDEYCPSANVSSGEGRFFAFSGRAGGETHIYRFDADSSEPAQRIDVGPAAPEASAYDSVSVGATCSNNGFPSAGPVRFLSDDGSHVFFDTYASLVTADTNLSVNGINGRVDAYQWHNGQVSLLSSGTNPSIAGSGFVGADSSGKNAFILTDEPLVPQDGDDKMDLYDVRASGGFAVEMAPPCRGDACQGTTPAATGGAAAVASSTFTGPGNAKAAKHRKGHKKRRKTKKHGERHHKRTAYHDRRPSR